MSKNIGKYHQAALSYVGIGVVIVVLTTLFVPDAHYRSGFIPLLAGIVVLLALAYFISRGVRWLVIVIAMLAAGRSGWWIYSFIAFADEHTRLVYIINAGLNMIVIYMLARAAAEKITIAH